MPTLTIDFTAPQAVRIAESYGKELNLQTEATYDEEGVELTPAVPRDADMAEVKHKVIQQIKSVVFAQERAAKNAAITVDELEPS